MDTMKYPSSSSGIKVVGHFTNITKAITDSTTNEPIATLGLIKSHFTERLYVRCIASLNRSKAWNKRFFFLGVGFRRMAQSAGERVKEFNPLNTVEAAMVKANCL